LLDSQRATRARHVVVVFMVTLAMITYLDRACIGVMMPSIAAEFGLDAGQQSWVFFAFILAYAAFEIPTARWADRHGAKSVLARIVAWWSVFTMATAGAFNYLSLLAARFLFGMGEAGAWPCVARVMSRWIPKRDRATAKGIFFAGAYASASLTTLLVTPLLSHVSWRSILLAFGCVGFVWIAADPGVLLAFNPYYGANFLLHHGMIGLYTLGAVFLAVTGAEALYADLGHFGRGPIRFAWLAVVLPAIRSTFA